MMNRKIVLWLCSFAFLILLITPVITADTYSTGDTVFVRYPSSGYSYTVLEKPKFVRYTLKDPSDSIVYEEDHDVTYLKDLGFGLAWEFYDEYTFRIPSFPQAGTWKVEGRLFSELWIIEDPALFPLSYEFEVEESPLLENLFAPWYFTLDMGFIFGRVSGSLPVHWSIIVAFLIAVVVAILFVRKKIKDLEVPASRGKKK